MQNQESAVSTSGATVVRLDKDFIKVTVKAGLAIDLSQMDELSRAYDTLVGPDKPFYLLTALPEDLNPSKELRDQWRSRERCRRKLAEAVVIQGTAMTIIANFVHKMETPRHRVKYFKDEADALAWIKRMKQKDLTALSANSRAGFN